MKTLFALKRDGKGLVWDYDEDIKKVAYAIADCTIDELRNNKSELYDIISNALLCILASDTSDTMKKSFVEWLEETVPAIRERITTLPEYDDMVKIAHAMMGTQEQ